MILLRNTTAGHCSAEGCNRAVVARQLCTLHYQRSKAAGTLPPKQYTTRAAAVLAGCVPVPESGCWIWERSTDLRGYGQVSIGGNRAAQAHRVAYEEFVDAIPVGMCVCHKCDTPSCVNPDHLFLGTHAENMADMAHKGRAVGRPRAKKNELIGATN